MKSATTDCAWLALANFGGHETVIIKDAGHWVYHDQLDVVVTPGYI